MCSVGDIGELRCRWRWLFLNVHVTIHRLCQLRIHLIRDGHDIGQQQAEIQRTYIALQHLEQGHLQRGNDGKPSKCASAASC